MRRILKWFDRFLGHRVYSATAGGNVGHNWLITDTSATGTPTYAPVDGGRGVKIDHNNAAEVQNICLSWGDLEGIDIDDLVEIRLRVKMNQAAVNAATSLAFGLCSARNDAIDAIAHQASFRVIGADSATLVVVETDDAVVDLDDKATGKTLATVAKDFVISFAAGKNDVRFFIDGQPVATSTTFDMSNYSGLFQPYLQLQKSAAASTDGVTLEDVEITSRQAA